MKNAEDQNFSILWELRQRVLWYLLLLVEIVSPLPRRG